MSTSLQAAYGLVMVLIGGLKTWLHMGTVPVLALPTCNGKTIAVQLSGQSWFEQAHCWGCYMFAAGLALLVWALYRHIIQRRSVAVRMD